jgi:hypothetical protein
MDVHDDRCIAMTVCHRTGRHAVPGATDMRNEDLAFLARQSYA